MLKVDYGQTECIAKFGKDPRVYQTTVKEFFKDEAGNLTGAVISYLKPERDPETGRTSMVPTGEEFTYDCELVLDRRRLYGLRELCGRCLRRRADEPRHCGRCEAPTWTRCSPAAICAAARALSSGRCARAATAPPR